MNDNEKWVAATENDPSYDGRFFYAVKSTGIFCRPSCTSKRPDRKNVLFFDTAQEAMKNGYRPCKRCRPDLLDYQPTLEIAEKMKKLIDQFFADRTALSDEFLKLGVSGHRMAEIFRGQYGKTPAEYADDHRIRTAKVSLTNESEPIADIAISLGFEGMSSFYAFFRKHMQMTPGEYRRLHKNESNPEDETYASYDLAFGAIAIASSEAGVTEVRFLETKELQTVEKGGKIADAAAEQLEEYFKGQRNSFDLPLAPAGTAFQRSVWTALQSIPYGETRTYKQVAQMIGNAGASRAVGMANNKNPLLILIPCHRVVGADGSLVGYAGGLAIKKRLLELEQRSLYE